MWKEDGCEDCPSFTERLAMAGSRPSSYQSESFVNVRAPHGGGMNITRRTNDVVRTYLTEKGWDER